MGKISAIVCTLVILLSTGLVSGEGIATEPHPNACSHTGALQVKAEGLEGGYKNPENPLQIIYEPAGFRKKLKIVLSPKYLGSITTAYPFRG